MYFKGAFLTLKALYTVVGGKLMLYICVCVYIHYPNSAINYRYKSGTTPVLFAWA